jgi:DNA topoisomerase IA
VLRAKFSALTNDDISNAMDNLVQPDVNLNNAAKVRSEIDLRIGASFTRF